MHLIFRFQFVFFPSCFNEFWWWVMLVNKIATKDLFWSHSFSQQIWAYYTKEQKFCWTSFWIISLLSHLSVVSCNFRDLHLLNQDCICPLRQDISTCVLLVFADLGLFGVTFALVVDRWTERVAIISNKMKPESNVVDWPLKISQKQCKLDLKRSSTVIHS